MVKGARHALKKRYLVVTPTQPTTLFDTSQMIYSQTIYLFVTK